MLHKLPVVSVDIYDTVELMTVEICVEDGTDTDMLKMIFNMIVLETKYPILHHTYRWQWLVNKPTKYIVKCLLWQDTSPGDDDDTADVNLWHPS